MSSRSLRKVLVSFGMAVAIAGVAALGVHAAVARTAPDPIRLILDLLGRLNLSADQKAQIRSIASQHKDELLVIAEGEKQARTDLQAAIRQESVDPAAIEQACARTASLDADLAVQRAELYSELMPLLTSTQKGELKKFVDEQKSAIKARVAELVANPDYSAFDSLNLSDEQKAEIRKILTSHKNAGSALLKSERKVRTALIGAIRQPVPNETAVRKACAAVAQADLQIALERAMVYSEVSAVLDGTQKAELNRILQELSQKVIDQIQMVINFLRFAL